MRINKKTAAAAAVFFIVFFVYIAALNPAFHANDSPETISCAYTLGIQHPPGYPIFSIIGKLFTFIPAGSPAFRVNLEAAFFGALSAVLLFLVAGEAIRRRKNGIFPEYLIPAAAALFFAFSYTPWSEALSAKGGIYTLNTFFLGLITYTLFLWERKKDKRYLYLAGFVYGLSLANHWESIAVATPAFFLFIYLVFRKEKVPFKKAVKHTAISSAFVLPGLFCYLFLMIRSAGGAALNWGEPETLPRLMDVILREQYASLEKAKDAEVIIRQVSRIAEKIFSEFYLYGLALAAAGIAGFILIKKKEKLFFFAAAAFTYIAALSVYFNLQKEMIWIIDVFLIPVYFVMAVFLAAGLNLLEIWGRRAGKETAAKAALTVLIAAAVFIQPARNFGKTGQQEYFYAYDFGMNIIKSIEEPAIALLEGDFFVMPQMYFRYVDKKAGFCPVITLFMYKPWGFRDVKRQCPEVKVTANENAPLTTKINNVVANNFMNKNIYVSVFRSAFEEFYPRGNALLKPAGLVMRLSYDPKRSLAEAEANMKKISMRNVTADRLYMNTTTRICVSNYSSAFMELGQAFRAAGNYEKAEKYLKKAVETATSRTKPQAAVHLGILYAMTKKYKKAIGLYNEAIKEGPETAEAYSNLAGIYNQTGNYDKAVEISRQALEIKPKFPEAYNNLGVAYYSKGKKQEALKCFEKAVKLDPKNKTAVKNYKAVKGELK